MVIVPLAHKAPTGALRSHCKLRGHLAARPGSFSRIKARGDTQGPRARAIATSWRAYLEALDGLDPKLNQFIGQNEIHFLCVFVVVSKQAKSTEQDCERNIIAPICKLIGQNETKSR